MADALFLTNLAAVALPDPIKTEHDKADLLMWGIVLFGLTLIAGAIVMWLRHGYLKGQEEPPREGFTLADLRAMRDRGDLTANEYEVAKNKMVASFKRADQKKKKGEATQGDGGANP